MDKSYTQKYTDKTEKRVYLNVKSFITKVEIYPVSAFLSNFFYTIFKPFLELRLFENVVNTFEYFKD